MNCQYVLELSVAINKLSFQDSHQAYSCNPLKSGITSILAWMEARERRLLEVSVEVIGGVGSFSKSYEPRQAN